MDEQEFLEALRDGLEATQDTIESANVNRVGLTIKMMDGSKYLVKVTQLEMADGDLDDEDDDDDDDETEIPWR
jgi:2-C-methyl-D-erythritol 4-phosphate cytidylyltransferase